MKTMKSKMSKMIAIILVMTMSMSMSVYAFADSSVTKSKGVDILTESVERGPNPPTKFKNLSVGSYDFSGTFLAMLYTNYYFSPNSSGELSVHADATIDNNYTIPTTLTFTLVDKTTGRAVSSASATTEKIPGSSSYSRYISLGHTFSSLNANHFYYVRINKTENGFETDISGSVSW